MVNRQMELTIFQLASMGWFAASRFARAKASKTITHERQTPARRFRHGHAFLALWFALANVLAFRTHLAAESAGGSVPPCPHNPIGRDSSNDAMIAVNVPALQDRQDLAGLCKSSRPHVVGFRLSIGAAYHCALALLVTSQPPSASATTPRRAGL